MSQHSQMSNAYSNAIRQALEAVKYAQELLRNPTQYMNPRPLKTLSEHDYIAYRALKEIEKKLEILEENAWFIQKSSR